MISADVVHHQIAARNLLMGESVFVSLALPKSWTISIGAGRPEITASHERAGRRWVATGDAWYVLHDGERRWAMELRLSARPAGRRTREVAAPVSMVCGHPASVTWQRRRRGLWKRWPVTYVTVQFCCTITDRQLQVEFSGRSPDEVFQEVLEAATYLRCH